MKRWALSSLLALLGCAGTETGNPPFRGTLGYDAYSSQPARVALRSADGEVAPVVVDAVWLVLGDVQFDMTKGCGPRTDFFEVPGLGTGDHAGTQAPATPVEFPNGRYCGVTVALDRSGPPPSAAPAELQGHSILLEGTQQGRKFRVVSSIQGALALHAGKGFVIEPEQPGVVIGFDVGAWLANTRWGDVSPDATGTLRIDAETPELLREFETRFQDGVTLFRDKDGDGKLDESAEPVERSFE